MLGQGHSHEQCESSPKGFKDQQAATGKKRAKSTRRIQMVREAMEKRNRVTDAAPAYGSREKSVVSWGYSRGRGQEAE